MAKALFCSECGAVKTLHPSGSTTFCDCQHGNVVGWWVDQSTGLAQIGVLPPGNRDQARVVLMHNRFLRADIETIPSGVVGPDGKIIPMNPAQVDQQWREVHTQATYLPPRPESLQIFDHSRRACVMVVQKPGETPDTHWAEEPEFLRRGLLESARA